MTASLPGPEQEQNRKKQRKTPTEVRWVPVKYNQTETDHRFGTERDGDATKKGVDAMFFLLLLPLRYSCVPCDASWQWMLLAQLLTVLGCTRPATMAHTVARLLLRRHHMSYVFLMQTRAPAMR